MTLETIALITICFLCYMFIAFLLVQWFAAGLADREDKKAMETILKNRQEYLNKYVDIDNQ